MQITVGCDGIVSDISVEDSSGLTGDLVSCVVDTLSYAPFPAHDTPDGAAFIYPMTLHVPAGARVAVSN